MNIDYYSSYAPQMAENGKFAPIDLSTLSPSYSGTGRYAILTYLVGGNQGTMITRNNTTSQYSQTIGAFASSVVTFSPAVETIEIYNNSNYNISLTFLANQTFTDAVNNGMIIPANSFYSVDRLSTTMTLANSTVSAVNVRILGHYTV